MAGARAVGRPSTGTVSVPVHVSATTDPSSSGDADTCAVGVFDDEPPGGAHAAAVAELLDRGEARTRARHLAVTHEGQRRLIVVGLGSRARFDPEVARRAGAAVQRRAAELGTRRLAWELPATSDPAPAQIADALVCATVLAAYRFDRYRRAPADPPAQLEQLQIVGAPDPGTVAAVDHAAVLSAAQNRARDLGNMAPNELTPSALADRAVALADRFDTLSCEILDEAELRERGMGAFAAVAQGSAQPARLIILRYEGRPGSSATTTGRRLALIGKAVTFDSGGLNIKPGASMISMKFDMAGGAAVLETVAALAQLQAPVRVLALIGATENMINGAAMRPGDILTALDGTTIEMNNADAEGRLVLADCITHARREGCDAIVDVATLTGGVVTALGSIYAGLFANDDALARRLLETGERTGELLWRLPLHPAYAEMVHGRYAQITNRTERREAAAVTAAEFLHHFAGDQPWAHLDIAGVGDDGRAPYLDKGATGFGVRLLTELALSF